MGGNGSGRPKALIDSNSLVDMATAGWTQKDMADELGVSIPTLSRKIAELQSSQNVLLQYRALQSLELTKLQNEILEHITPEKIAEAPLRDLVVAYKILKDRELVIEGKPTEIKGLLGYLVQLEKEDAACQSPVDVDFEEAKDEESDLPNL